MVNKKVELLTKLKKRIKEQGTIKFKYKETVNNECKFCAVGHVMDICGTDWSNLTEDSWLNGAGVGGFYREFPIDNVFRNGLPLNELGMLQEYNDVGGSEAVIKYIDELLEEARRGK
jgi:hypothetical protein